MKKINHDELPDESEIVCASLFIKKYNSIKGTDYQDIARSDVQNETDIFCYTPDHSDFLKIQVLKPDQATLTGLWKGKKKPPMERIAAIKGNGQFLMRIPNVIRLAEEKYIEQKKDISNTLLVLDEAGSPPEFLLREVVKNIKTSAFKEVWVVCSNKTVFRLF